MIVCKIAIPGNGWRQISKKFIIIIIIVEIIFFS